MLMPMTLSTVYKDTEITVKYLSPTTNDHERSYCSQLNEWRRCFYWHGT